MSVIVSETSVTVVILNTTFIMPGLGLPSMDTMDSQDGLKTIILPLFLNIFFYFHPADTLCDDFSLVDSVKTYDDKPN